MLPREILQAEIVDWWEAERSRVKEACEDRADRLRTLVKAEAYDLSTKDLVSKKSEARTKLESRVASDIEKFNQDLSLQINGTLLKSVIEYEGKEEFSGQSTAELTKMLASNGGAIGSFSLLALAPLAIPAPSGFLAALGGGTIATGAWIPLAAIGAAALTLGALSPQLRNATKSKLRLRYIEHLRGSVTERLCGEPKQGISTLQYYLSRLDTARDKRMEDANAGR